MRKPLLPFIGYLAFFYLAWTFVWVHGVYPWANRTWRRDTRVRAHQHRLQVLDPVFGYLRYVDRVDILVTWNSILGTSILIGVFEEAPFRGFVLRKVQERFGFVTSVVISSVLFAGAHILGWIMLGSLTVSRAVYIFAFGSIMAIVLRYSGIAVGADHRAQPE
jgi:membrane protease YdiL (CAAX protease family)